PGRCRGARRRDRRPRGHRGRRPARVHPRRRRHRSSRRWHGHAARRPGERRPAGCVPQGRHRIHFRRPAQGRRVPQSYPARKSRPWLSRRDLALRRHRPRRRGKKGRRHRRRVAYSRSVYRGRFVATIRRQPAKGIVRARNGGRAASAAGRRADQGRRYRRAQRNLSAPPRRRGSRLAVLVSSADGIELEGLCDRVLIFARGRVVRTLEGADVTDASITEANLTATASRATGGGAAGARGEFWHRLLASDHFPAIILAVLTIAILAGTQAMNGYFLSPINIKSMLSFLGILTFVSAAQLATILV